MNDNKKTLLRHTALLKQAALLKHTAHIFDLDGTLLDSMDVWHKVDIDFLHKRGITVPPDYPQAISALTFYETADYTIRRFGLSDSIEDLQREWNEMAVYSYKHNVQLKPYAKEYLTALRGSARQGGARQSGDIKLAVATSLPAELHKPALQSHGIYDFFHAICTTDEAGQGKTHPDVFLLAAKKIGAQPSDCVVYEDILAAVKSAKSAGMTVCAVYDNASKADWEEIKKYADYAILDYSDASLGFNK